MINAKQYLRDIKHMRRRLDRLRQRRANLHLDVSFGGIDYSADRVQSTPKNKLEEAMVRLSERMEALDNDIATLSLNIDDRINSIEKLTNDTHKSILFKRYVEDKTFEEISVEMGYVYNYTCNLHGEALGELSKVLN
jgi:SMC interacting uncharacterized protein involved in chromosome segregation